MAKKTFQQVAEERDHKTMIETPEYWPERPYLPMWRGTEESRELGVIVEGEPTRIYRVNLYSLKYGDKTPVDVPYLDYETVDVLLTDSWVVD